MTTQLIKWRDTCVHSSKEARLPIENMFVDGHCDQVTNATYYRICDANDVLFTDYDCNNGTFTSACRTLLSAKILLKRAPNPFANIIVEIFVNGSVIFMTYDDPAGPIKKYEDEVMIALSAITSIKILKD
jgi:hypothetical protein